MFPSGPGMQRLLSRTGELWWLLLAEHYGAVAACAPPIRRHPVRASGPALLVVKV
jgi:hypothetical protein